MRTASVQLGQSGVWVAPLAVGTWSWGDRRYWNYGEAFGPRDTVDAFGASVDAGVTLFDTAEVYGDGESEKILGWMVRKHGGALSVATKFAPLPGRTAKSVAPALTTSLRRLGLRQIDLYQVHWCDTDVAAIGEMMDALASQLQEGRVRALGVSNFSADEMRRAHDTLLKRGVTLASNQVHYSLLHRAPETDGVLDACRERGITLLAYSPLEQGVLTGRYAGGKLPSDARARTAAFSPQRLVASEGVIAKLREIGATRGKSPEQVALNWVRAKGGVPIAGARSGEQAERNAGALGWILEPGEVEMLDAATEGELTERGGSPS